MADWPLVAARLALYLDLGLLFGIAFFALTAGRLAARQALLPIARLSVGLACLGIALSLLGFAIQVASMSGTDLAHIYPAIAADLLMQTAIGWAFIVRIMALTVALLAVAFMPSYGAKFWSLSLLGGIAAASLAWAGHGASSEGLPGAVHLGADILHLLAASAWIGALFLLLMLVAPRAPVSRERIMVVHAGLAGFGVIGTALVGLIVITGLINGSFLIGLNGLPMLAGTPYGRLLLAKLLLFAVMLACAVANRFWLTPKLAALDAISPGKALASLRLSIALETIFALLILGLVAWMGTLEPPMSVL